MDLNQKRKAYRDLLIRCPRLGGEIPFSYCEQEAGKFPCRLVVSCWEARIPVEAYFRELLTPELWERFCSQVPKDRMATLVELAEAAKERGRVKK